MQGFFDILWKCRHMAAGANPCASSESRGEKTAPFRDYSAMAISNAFEKQ